MEKVLVLILLFTFICPVFANEKTWIRENHDGKVIITPEYIIEIPNWDSFDTRLWMKFDNVLILDSGYIINLDNGEKAEIKNIYHR